MRKLMKRLAAGAESLLLLCVISLPLLTTPVCAADDLSKYAGSYTGVVEVYLDGLDTGCSREIDISVAYIDGGLWPTTGQSYTFDPSTMTGRGEENEDSIHREYEWSFSVNGDTATLTYAYSHKKLNPDDLDFAQIRDFSEYTVDESRKEISIYNEFYEDENRAIQSRVWKNVFKGTMQIKETEPPPEVTPPPEEVTPNPGTIHNTTTANNQGGEFTNTGSDATIPEILVVGAGGAAAALGGGAVATANRRRRRDEDGDEGEEQEEPKPSTFRMYFYKDFGDAIKRGDDPKYVYARMVETTGEGRQVDRPDLSERITITAGANGLTVAEYGMTGSYKCAAVSAAENLEADNAAVTFRFTGEGGTYTNDLWFRVVGDPCIEFPDKDRLAIYHVVNGLYADGESLKQIVSVPARRESIITRAPVRRLEKQR